MKRNILIVALLQALFLCGMVAAKQYTLNVGEPVLLETQPIDPRSLFRGDYVRLNYSINTLDLETLMGDDEFQQHDTVFVVLESDGTYHQAVSVHRDMPESDNPIIKGKVTHVRTGSWNPETHAQDPANILVMRYGIENYFVPEGTGRELELRWSDGAEKRVDIRVAVDGRGNSGIKAVLVNGEEKYVETLF